jgi:hypothetical protein
MERTGNCSGDAGAFRFVLEGCVIAVRLIKIEVTSIRASAWYEKETPTFASAKAIVRGCLWGMRHFSTSDNNGDVLKIPRRLSGRSTGAVCYAASVDKVEISSSLPDWKIK